jgi:hypothetical protein
MVSFSSLLTLVFIWEQNNRISAYIFSIHQYQAEQFLHFGSFLNHRSSFLFTFIHTSLPALPLHYTMGAIQVPRKHKACIYDKPGTISTKIEEVDTAEPGYGEVLVNLYVCIELEPDSLTGL